MKKKVLLSSIMTIALCLCLIAGSTFALFTSSDKVNVAVTAGKVVLTADLDKTSMKTWSLYETEADARTDGLFANGGTAKITDEANVVIDRMTPGDVAKFKIDVKNQSNVGIQYRVRMVSNAGKHAVDLTEALVITAYIDGFVYPVTGTENATIWKYIEPYAQINDIWVTVNFPNETNKPAADYNGDGLLNDNDFQLAQANMTFIVEAVQGNAYDFAVATKEDDFFDSRGYISNGIYNGEGKTIPVTKETIGLDGAVTLANMTIDASKQNSIGMTFWDVDDEQDATLILADDTTIIAREDNLAIRSSMIGSNESFTLIIDETAKIVASGSDGAVLLAQGWEGSVVNVVLNGSASKCLELKNGAHGFGFFGNDDEILVVNMYVRNATEKAAYQALVEAENATVNWYIDGSYVGSIYYN